MKPLTAFAGFVVVASSLTTQSPGWTRMEAAPASSRAEIGTVADLDRDGWDDILYTSWDNCQVRLARNVLNPQTGGRQFLDAILIGSSSSCASELFQARNIEVARVLPDTMLPQILVSAFQGGHRMYVNTTGNWSGPWTPTTIDSGNYGPAGIVAGQIDSDGRPDIVTATQGFGGALGMVRMWRQLDTGQFQLVRERPAQDLSSLAIVDVDRDGRNDVIATIAGGLVWWRNTGSFGFAGDASWISSGLGQASKVKVVDLNRDGWMDYVVTSHDTGVSWIDGQSFTVSLVSSQYPGAYFVDAGFFSYPDDGFVDIVISTGTPSHAVVVFKRHANGTFTAEQVNSSQYLTGRSINIADLFHNGKRQLVTTSYGGGTVDVWEKQ